MSFEPLRTTRVYQQIADRIVGMIRDGELKPGDGLPTEGELARSFSAGRNAVREALIALEAAGVVEVRRNAGVHVRSAPLERAEAYWDRGDGTEPGPLEQFEVREALEPDAAFRAATRISPAQIAALETVVDRMQERYRYQANYEDGRAFAEIVAAASGNPLLLSMIQYLWCLRDGPMWTTLRRRIAANALRPDQRLRTIEHRRTVIRALANADPAAARAAYVAYLRYTRRVFFGDVGDEPSADTAAAPLQPIAPPPGPRRRSDKPSAP